MIKWSIEQELAINHSTSQNGSAIVSAAAGSGKTAMLVERIMRMITSENPKIPADKIVAVTFTNDAAGELKSRLEAEINNLKSTEKNDWLEEQLINLENANICTIHSFCIKILRDYAEEAGLNPNFKICEGKENEFYSESALNIALESIYDSEKFTAREKNSLRALTGEAGDYKIARAISELYEEYMKQPFPEDWLEEKAALYENPKIFKNLIAANAENEIKNKAKACLEKIEECFIYSYSETMTARLEADKCFAESWLYSQNGLLDYGNSNYGNVSEKHAGAKEIIKELRDEYIPVFKEIILTAGLLADFDFVISKQANGVKALTKLFKIYNAEFKRIKREANCVDFSDIEHYCLEILQNNEIAEKIKSEFHEIIVDEFQDSNAVQYEIFKRVSNGKNLFLVGDVKQSIYRFRNADPDVFKNVADDKNFTVLYLNKNFRSSKETINAVNNIFEKNMTREVGGVDYDERARLVFGAEKTFGSETEKSRQAELILIKTEDETGAEIKKAEADYIADRILKMIESGFKITEKDGSKRPCNYGDFAVLAGSLSTVEREFSAALEERGIPYDKQKSGDYSEVEEIKSIIALLTIIERPFEDMALLNLLMSPLYGFSADDIAEIRKIGVNKPLFDNLESYVKTEKSTEAFQKAKSFLEEHGRRASCAKNFGACKLIRQIYNEGGFNPLVAGSGMPAKTMINIRLLLHYSQALKGMTRDSLSGLIKLLEGKAGGAVLEEARYSGEGEKKVKLMTIHASKGLEFPVCFVARTHSRFNLRENYSDIIFNSEIGFAMRYIITEISTRCDTLPHVKAKEINQKAAVSEEIRKLYVACTRARDKLILTGIVNNEKIPENSFLIRLMNTEIEKVFIKVSEITNDILKKDSRQKSKINEKQEIIGAIKRTYHREELTKIPRRLTATQVFVKDDIALMSSPIDEYRDEPTIFPRTPSFMGAGKLTGKKRGDVYHKMMELIEFGGDYEAQINENKNRFTEEEFAAIEPQKIIEFFNSPLGRRAAASPKVHKEFKLCTEVTLAELGYPEELDVKFGEKPLIQGIADMFFYENGEIILADYKTNRNTTREKLTEQYKGQLDIYARAIEEMTGDRVAEKWVYSFELGGILIK